VTDDRRRDGGPPCVLCGRAPGAAPFHLTHGVSVTLCPSHRRTEYLRRREGRHFADRLERAWRAAGCATTRRLAALDSHRRAMRHRPPDRPRPGSYAWPELRIEAEARFAVGHDLADVERDLEALTRDSPVRPPSPRTLRRWRAEARWAQREPRPRTPARARPRLRRPRRSEWPELNWHWQPHPLGLLTLLWKDDLPPRRTHWRRT
jgi:hypothetical protein